MHAPVAPFEAVTWNAKTHGHEPGGTVGKERVDGEIGFAVDGDEIGVAVDGEIGTAVGLLDGYDDGDEIGAPVGT